MLRTTAGEDPVESVYTDRIYERQGLTVTQIAKIFRSGNSQAVRLPKEFRFDVDEVEISRDGNAVVLRPRASSAERWQNLRAALENGFSEDFMTNGREQPPMPPDDPNEMFD